MAEKKDYRKDNVLLLFMLSEIVDRFPDYSFNKILCNLNLVPLPVDMAYSEELRVYLKEFYYEESTETAERVLKMYNQLLNADK